MDGEKGVEKVETEEAGETKSGVHGTAHFFRTKSNGARDETLMSWENKYVCANYGDLGSAVAGRCWTLISADMREKDNISLKDKWTKIWVEITYSLSSYLT